MFKTILKSGKVKYQERYKDYITGKWKTVSVVMDKDTASTRKLAAAELARKIEERTAYTKNENITLKQLCKMYLSDQASSLRESTLYRNQNALNKIIKLLDPDAIVDNLNVLYIRDRLKSVEQKKLHEYLVRFKVMLNWGYQNELISNHDLILKLKVPSDPERKERIADKYLEPDEVTALLNEMKISDWNLLTKFLLLSGLRIGEAMSLDYSDIDDKYIHITKTYMMVAHTISPHPKTSSGIRDVFIQPELAKVIKECKSNELQKQILYGRKSKYIFSAADGGCIHYDAYRQYLGDTSERAIGRRITPHALRHTHASLLLADGIDLDAISRRLGHADSKITKEIYIHMTEKLKESEEDKIAKVNIL